MSDESESQNSAPPALCKACEPITFDDSIGTIAARHQQTNNPAAAWERRDTLPDLLELTSSSKAGCSFCGYLLSVIKRELPGPRAQALATANKGSVITITFDPDDSERRADYVAVTSWESTTLEDDQDGYYRLTLVFENENWRSPWRHVATAYAGSQQVAQHLGISLRLPAAHVLEPNCLTLLDSWISNCESNHVRCKPTNAASAGLQELPTRLIDIKGTPGSPPHLIITASLSPPVEYIALSYCWGPASRAKPQLTTTSKTLQAHQNGIAISTMPLTFQDLIVLANHFGIRYLWIDALCIVQDDYADWEREAARMFMVYRNAHLTVVVGGPSCHSGFLERTSMTPFATIPFRSSRDTNMTGSYILASIRDTRTWEADGPHHMSQASWGKRGWTFQEDIMSRRVLYFTEKTSFYRCQTHRCLEQDTFTYDDVRHWDTILYPTPRKLPSKRFYHMWESLVVTYAERKLTKECDKFPALSGLARMFAGVLQDEYIAGLWRRGFHRGMLWYTYSNASRPTTWRAPSWSWASWDGIVEVLPRAGEPVTSQICINSVHTEPAGSDPLSKLRDGWIILAARARPITLRKTTDDLDPSMLWHADVVDDDANVIAHGSLDSITFSGLRIDGSYKPAPVDEIAQFSNVFAVLVALTSEPRIEADGEGKEDWPEPSYPVGILVTPDATLNPGAVVTYKRVGLFHTRELQNPKLGMWEKIPKREFKLI